MPLASEHEVKEILKNASHVFDIHLNSEHCTYLSNIAAIGVVTNSVLNPVIYSFLSTNFRQKVTRRTRNFIRMRKYSKNLLSLSIFLNQS